MDSSNAGASALPAGYPAQPGARRGNDRLAGHVDDTRLLRDLWLSPSGCNGRLFRAPLGLVRSWRRPPPLFSIWKVGNWGSGRFRSPNEVDENLHRGRGPRLLSESNDSQKKDAVDRNG